MKRFIFIALALLFSVSFANAQQQNKLCVQNGNSCVPVDPTNPLPVQQIAPSAVNITTSTDTNVKATPGIFEGIIVNTGGTTSTAKIYNDADGTCSSGLIATFATTVQVTLLAGINMSIGICVKTAGGAPADITILYK